MNAKKCDRCGVFFNIHDNHLILKEEKITGPLYSFKNKYDLCLMCQEEFYNFMNNYKEVIKNEKKQSKNS